MWSSGAFGYLLDYVLWWVLFLSLVAHTWCFFRFFPSQASPKAALVLGNLFVFFCFTGAVALVGESYFRFVAVRTDSFGMSLPAQRWFAIHTRLNSLGFRDDEWSPDKPMGVRRIAFVGDSFTYGWGIEKPEDRFSDIITARLNSRGPGGVEGMNVAKPGWGTQDQIEPIGRMIRDFHVDEVVLCYVPNDIELLLPRSEAFNPISPPQPVYFDSIRSSLLDFLYRRVYVPRLPTVRHYHDWLADGFADDAIWREHQRHLGAIIQSCKDAQATLRVVLLPFVVTSGETLDMAALHSKLRRYFESNGIAVVDLEPAIRGRPPAELVVNGGDPHPNKLAHRLFADAIWDAFYGGGQP